MNNLFKGNRSIYFNIYFHDILEYVHYELCVCLSPKGELQILVRNN